MLPFILVHGMGKVVTQAINYMHIPDIMVVVIFQKLIPMVPLQVQIPLQPMRSFINKKDPYQHQIASVLNEYTLY